MSLASEPPGTSGPTLADRILGLVSRRGFAGITQDELLRKLGVAYDDLAVALEDLRSRGLVRIHWPSPDSFRVVYTG